MLLKARYRVTDAVLLALTLSFSLSAFAHRVNVFAWPEAGKMVVESGFSGNNPARGADIAVSTTENGPVLLKGKTDEKGMFRFAVSRNWRIDQGLVVTVNAGEGHRNTWTIGPDKLKIALDSGVAESVRQDNADTIANVSMEMTTGNKNEIIAAQNLPLTKEELEAVVARALAQQLAPIEKRLAESLNPPIRLSDIIGGIGWLVGLGGIAAYFSRREKSDGKSDRRGP